MDWKFLSGATFLDKIGESGLTDLLLVGGGGIVALLLILKWIIQFQKHFTDAYVGENKELRQRLDSLDEELTHARLEFTRLERESRIRIFELEDQVRELSRQLNERNKE